jgi:hypothetical protein
MNLFQKKVSSTNGDNILSELRQGVNVVKRFSLCHGLAPWTKEQRQVLQYFQPSLLRRRAYNAEWEHLNGPRLRYALA